ncbi:archease [candidate division WOR-3 bacterium]|nr:archease [candidate division WOR-3 bacterium]
MKYKFLEDLTSDVMFEAYGRSLEELLENSALAMFSVVCDIKKVRALKSIKIEISSPDEQSLLHTWLSELLTQSEINCMFLSKFKVKRIETIDGLHLFGTASGEDMSPKLGETVVKGVTYYGFKLEKTDSGYKAQVALDI